ncbi:hypothetical protein E4T56_gene4950 [Termitomyces sp. T112]|nr:hypothetical protein E4T56_gene4950 [Termitomyces sp. T112]
MIQKVRDDIRNDSAYLNQREMRAFTTKCNKLCDQVETQLQDYYRGHLIKRYYLASVIAITKALELDQDCKELYELVWHASTDAKANKERQLGLNFAEKPEDVLSDCELSLDDSISENGESSSEPPDTISNLQDSSSLPDLRFVLPPRITPSVMSPDRMSLLNFFGTVLPLYRTQKLIAAPEATFEMTTLDCDGHANIKSTQEESAYE